MPGTDLNKCKQVCKQLDADNVVVAVINEEEVLPVTSVTITSEHTDLPVYVTSEETDLLPVSFANRETVACIVEGTEVLPVTVTSEETNFLPPPETKNQVCSPLDASNVVATITGEQTEFLLPLETKIQLCKPLDASNVFAIITSEQTDLLQPPETKKSKIKLYRNWRSLPTTLVVSVPQTAPENAPSQLFKELEPSSLPKAHSSSPPVSKTRRKRPWRKPAVVRSRNPSDLDADTSGLINLANTNTSSTSSACTSLKPTFPCHVLDASYTHHVLDASSTHRALGVGSTHNSVGAISKDCHSLKFIFRSSTTGTCNVDASLTTRCLPVVSSTNGTTLTTSATTITIAGTKARNAAVSGAIASDIPITSPTISCSVRSAKPTVRTEDTGDEELLEGDW